MEGIIFVLHGRRNKLAKANLNLIETLGQQLEQPTCIGLLEGTELTIEDAIDTLLSQQVTKLTFVPVLLFPATHAKKDLPERAAKHLQAKVPYRILKTLGTTKAVEDFLVQQAARSTKATLLLLAHGTPHDEDTYQQLAEIATKITARTGKTILPSQYIGSHSYQTILKAQAPCGILQLFLTEGKITNKIHQEIIEVRGKVDEFYPTLEDTPALAQAIMERLESDDVSDTY
jgi:sirohydrochlorin ferrochelatase